MTHPTLRECVKRRLRADDTYAKARMRVQRNDAFDDVVDAAVGVVLGAVQAELDALIRDGDYYEQFELGRKMKLLDSDEVLAVLARLGGTT